jgi:nucleotide-binding universal stress UspA family protein
MPAPFRNILVATDFSEIAAAALGRALALAEKDPDVKITVLHVIADVAGAVPGTSFAGHWRIPTAELHHAEEKLRHLATERLGAWIQPFLRPDRELITQVRVGVSFVEIIRAVLQGGYNLVLNGTRGHSTLGRWFVGSTAERLIRKCPCPVWIVHPRHEWPLRSILAPVDLSDTSAHSLRLACALAERCGCPVTALYVFNFPNEEVVTLPPGAGEFGVLPAPPPRRVVRKQAAHELNEFIKLHVPEGTPVKQQLGVGYPWRIIIQAAKKLDAGVIVMGSVGRRGIPGFLIGNTAEKVLRHCDRSLLTLKPDDFVSPVTV